MALDKTAGGGGTRVVGGGGEIQFCSSTGTEKYSFTVLQGQKNTVLQFYWDREKIEENHVLKIPYYKKSHMITTYTWVDE